MFTTFQRMVALILLIFPMSVFAATTAFGPFTTGRSSPALDVLLDIINGRDTKPAQNFLESLEKTIEKDELAIVLEGPEFENIVVQFISRVSTEGRSTQGQTVVYHRMEQPTEQCADMSALSFEQRIDCYVDGISYDLRTTYFTGGGSSVKEAIELNADLLMGLLPSYTKGRFLKEAKLEEEVRSLREVLYTTSDMTWYVFESHGYRIDLTAPLLWSKTEESTNPLISKVIKGGKFLAQNGLIFLDINHAMPAGLGMDAVVIEKEKFVPASHHYMMGYDLEHAFEEAMGNRGFHYVDGEWK